VMHEDSVDLAAVAGIYAALEREAVETLERDGIEASRIRIVREADVRYAGQSMEVRVPAPGGAVDASFLARLIEAFNAAHLRTFGYNYAGQQKIELVNFCVSGFGVMERPGMPKLEAATVNPESTGVRPVYFGGSFLSTPIYDRASLPPGYRLTGPAIVEEFGSTTVVFPGQNLEVDLHGILIVRKGGF
jgi:N-methylhydantoinase A